MLLLRDKLNPFHPRFCATLSDLRRARLLRPLGLVPIEPVLCADQTPGFVSEVIPGNERLRYYLEDGALSPGRALALVLALERRIREREGIAGQGEHGVALFLPGNHRLGAPRRPRVVRCDERAGAPHDRHGGTACPVSRPTDSMGHRPLGSGAGWGPPPKLPRYFAEAAGGRSGEQLCTDGHPKLTDQATDFPQPRVVLAT